MLFRGKLSSIIFAELVELQSLHLQRDENSISGAFAHPSYNSHKGCGCRKNAWPKQDGEQRSEPDLFTISPLPNIKTAIVSSTCRPSDPAVNVREREGPAQ